MCIYVSVKCLYYNYIKKYLRRKVNKTLKLNLSNALFSMNTIIKR